MVNIGSIIVGRYLIEPGSIVIGHRSSIDGQNAITL